MSKVKMSLEGIYQRLSNIDDKLLKLHEDFRIQNGRVNQSEKDIALLKQRNELDLEKEKALKTQMADIDKWGRKKLLFWGGVWASLAFVALNLLIEYIKNNLR